MEGHSYIHVQVIASLSTIHIDTTKGQSVMENGITAK